MKKVVIGISVIIIIVLVVLFINRDKSFKETAPGKGAHATFSANANGH